MSSWKEFQQASSQDEEVTVGGIKIGFPNGRPTFKTADGAYALSIGLAFQEDFGGFLGISQRNGESRGNFNSFTSNSRRLRIPFSFRYKDWVANVTPDFGHGNFDGQVGLYEANINYAGLHNTILTAGYFQPRVTEEDAESSNDFLLLERPAIVDLVRRLPPTMPASASVASIMQTAGGSAATLLDKAGVTAPKTSITFPLANM